MGVSVFFFFRCPRIPAEVSFSLPNAMQFEKFHVPDSIRILDAIMETLSY